MRRTRRARIRAEQAFDQATGGAVTTVYDTIRWLRDEIGRARVSGLARLVRCDDRLVIEYSTDRARARLEPVWNAVRMIRSWEPGRIIYRLDPTLVDVLVASDNGAALRSDVLRRVPHGNPCLVFTRPIDALHPGGGTVRYTTVFVAGQRVGSDGYLESCDLHDPAATGIGFVLGGTHERLDDTIVRTISVVTVDIAHDEIHATMMTTNAPAEGRGTACGLPASVATILDTLIPTVLYLGGAKPDLQRVAMPDGASWRDASPADRWPDVHEIGWRAGAALRERRDQPMR